MDKWDRRFMELAALIASWSKDPSTKTGAVIVDPDRRIVGTGYNGFAKGVDDREDRYNDRDTKYKMVVHCERNAMLFAQRSLKGCTLYTWPFMSCAPCAAMVIQAGITRCVAPTAPAGIEERWRSDLELAKIMFKESGVKLDLF